MNEEIFLRFGGFSRVSFLSMPLHFKGRKK
jgi:hypothetical protein